jgi:nucleoid-associated protein YgaU
LSCATVGVSTARAQDQSVAEAARQERARKDQEQKSPRHVYTNEDLKRARILTPEDQARVEARKNECPQDPQKKSCLPAPQQNAPGSLDANAPQQTAPGAQDANSQQLSLGEVARQYRKERELEVLQPQQSEPFHLGLPATALAAPIVPAHPVIDIPAPPVLRPETHGTIFRRDPFARVPLRPRPELANTSRLHPAPRPPARLAAPAAPTFSPAPLPHEPVGAFASRMPARPPLRFAPAPPSAPRPHHSATLPAAPKISPAPLPHEPAGTFQSKKPARPTVRLAPVQPSTPLPRRRATLPAAPANMVPSVKPSAPLAVPSAQPAAPVAPKETVRPVQPRRPLLSSPAAPSLVAPKVATPSLATPAPAAPAPSVAGTVRVQPGDSLWKLALQHFGRGSAWPQILAANPNIADPNQLHIGASLKLPAVLATHAAPKTPGSPLRTIKVQKGDTLWALANSYFGHSSNWPCLAAANPSLASPDLIFAGQELSVPSACSSSSPSPRRAKE